MFLPDIRLLPSDIKNVIKLGITFKVIFPFRRHKQMLLNKLVEQLRAASNGGTDRADVTDILQNISPEQLLEIMGDNSMYKWIDAQTDGPISDGPVNDSDCHTMTIVVNHLIGIAKQATNLSKDLMKLAFIYSCWIGDKDLANTVLKLCSSVGSNSSELLTARTDVLKLTPLHMAFKANNSAMVIYLFHASKEHERFQDVLFTTDMYHKIALHYGIEKNALDAVKTFLDLVGEDKEICEKVLLHGDSCGYTALHYSTTRDNPDIAQTLINAAKNNKDLLEKMLLQGNITDDTALAEAARHSVNAEVVKLLLDTAKEQG